MELVGMQCNKNNFYSYYGYKRTEYIAQKPFRKAYLNGDWDYIAYNASIDINKGWGSFNIRVTRKENHKASLDSKK